MPDAETLTAEGIRAQLREGFENALDRLIGKLPVSQWEFYEVDVKLRAAGAESASDGAEERLRFSMLQEALTYARRQQDAAFNALANALADRDRRIAVLEDELRHRYVPVR